VIKEINRLTALLKTQPVTSSSW